MKAMAGLLTLLLAGSLPAQDVPRGIPRFPVEHGPLALRGPARPGVYLADQGRRAALLGSETGGFEVWTWPLKLVRDLDLAFRIPEYDEPIPAARVAREVVAGPAGATIVYSHAAFTVRQHLFVPLHEPGAVMLLDVETVRPLEVLVRMHADFGLAWPGSFGGGFITWQPEPRRFLLSQGGLRGFNGMIGSPFAQGGTVHAAHDAALVPSQFTLRFDTAQAGRELIPIVMAGGALARDSVEAAYQRILRNAAQLWREKVAHYDSVRTTQLSIGTPDAQLDLALEWAKVNLDQQLVCNPELGCGLVAGFGRAGPNNFRPGFGWFFGGDAAINSFAMDALGQHGLVRDGLRFLARYQRADGKIPHEISQAAARLPWFEDYPYTWFHGDTTPFWILACYWYWLASGDEALIAELWPNLERAFRWSAATDRNGDGLMENPAAGAGAIEVGGLGENLLTDIYLAGVWVGALEGVRALAEVSGDAAARRDAEEMFQRAQATLESGFWLDSAGIYAFALLAPADSGGNARLNDALTVWPATALAFGLLDAGRAGRMLEQIGSHALTTDWGVRMLARGHPLQEPLHYNNGTVWGFVTGFAALAHYRYHRGWAGHDLVRDVARTTFDFAPGRNPELMSGAFYRTLDTAVPQQFFATSMLVSPLLRGLLGIELDAPHGAVAIEPHLPAEWDSVRVRGLRVGDQVLEVAIERQSGTYLVNIRRLSGTGRLHARIAPALPLGARLLSARVNGADVPLQTEESAHDVHAVVETDIGDEVRVELEYRGGVELGAPAEDLRVGDASTSLRVLDLRREGGEVVIEMEGVAGREYALQLRMERPPETPRGARLERAGDRVTLRFELAGPAGSLARHEVRLRL